MLVELVNGSPKARDYEGNRLLINYHEIWRSLILCMVIRNGKPKSSKIFILIYIGMENTKFHFHTHLNVAAYSQSFETIIFGKIGQMWEGCLSVITFSDLGKTHFRDSYEKLHLILLLVSALHFLVWLLCRDLHSHFLTEDQVLSTSWSGCFV